MKSEQDLELGNILEESKEFSEDPRIPSLLEELIEYEKGFPGWYKDNIRTMLKKHMESK